MYSKMVKFSKQQNVQLIETKNNRYIIYNGRKYRIVSSSETGTILQDIDRILQTVLKTKNKRKRRRRKPKPKSVNTEPPKLQAFSNEIARDLKFENNQLQRELLQQSQKRIEQPTHDINKLLPDINIPKAGEYILTASNGKQYTITESQAQDVLNMQNELKSKQENIKLAENEIQELILESQRKGADKDQISQELGVVKHDLEHLTNEFQEKQNEFAKRENEFVRKLDKKRRQNNDAQLQLEKTRREIRKTNTIESIKKFNGTTVAPIRSEIIPDQQFHSHAEFIEHLDTLPVTELEDIEKKLLSSFRAEPKIKYKDEIAELRTNMNEE